MIEVKIVDGGIEWTAWANVLVAIVAVGVAFFVPWNQARLERVQLRLKALMLAEMLVEALEEKALAFGLPNADHDRLTKGQESADTLNEMRAELSIEVARTAMASFPAEKLKAARATEVFVRLAGIAQNVAEPIEHLEGLKSGMTSQASKLSIDTALVVARKRRADLINALS